MEIPQNLAVDRTFMQSTLSNGINIYSEYWPTKLSHIAIVIKCGSRDETEDTSGVAHFLEHLSFRGTNKRNMARLQTDIENFGGQINAATSREKTTYTMSCYSDKIQSAIEILSDMLMNSAYPKSHLEQERMIIYRELLETRQSQMQTALEVSHRGAYKGHQLSLPILGLMKNMQSITRDDIIKYHADNYYGENIIVCGVGDINHDHVCSLVDKYFCKVKSSTPKEHDKPVFKEQPFLMQSELTNDVNVCLLQEAPEWFHDQYYHFLVLQKLIENRPTKLLDVQTIEGLNTYQKKLQYCEKALMQKPFYLPYKDTGLFGNYFYAEHDNIDNCVKFQTELYESITNKITTQELELAKRRLFMELLQEHTGETILQSLIQQVVNKNQRIYRQEIAQKISQINEQDIQKTISEWLINKPVQMSLWGNIQPIANSFNISDIGTH